jgi:hypothetical protein
MKAPKACTETARPVGPTPKNGGIVNNYRCAAAVAIIATALTWMRPTPVSAHHSYSAFEMQKTITITGTVKKMDWTNPHTWLWVDVPNEKGTVDTWAIEGMSPNFLARRGWTKNTLKYGDKITIEVHPLKDGSHGGSFQSATRPNGESLTMTPPISEP